MCEKFYDWAQQGESSDPKQPLLWYLNMQMSWNKTHDLTAGCHIADWDPDTTAWYDEELEHTDFPSTDMDLPVYSPRLKSLLEDLGITEIQYLPIQIQHRPTGRVIHGYHLANYLRVIDCVDRERSVYQVWTKDNLMFWERRPEMLGTFRGLQQAVLDSTAIGDCRLFRVWGWPAMVVAREDVKQAMDQAGITGSWFTEITVI